MTKENLPTDKMYLVHKPTGKRFLLAWHARSGWMVEVLQFPSRKDIEKQYLNQLSKLFNECYANNYEEFQKNATAWAVRFESDGA